MQNYFHVPSTYRKPHASSKREVFERYIKAKYVEKVFKKREGLKPCPPLWDEVDRGRGFSKGGKQDASLSGMIKYTGVCNILVQKCTNLPNADYFSESDPYLILTNGPFQKARTKQVNNNNNPIWNQMVNLTVQDKEYINLFVFDKKRLVRDVVLAEGKFKLRVDEEESYQENIHLTVSPKFKNQYANKENKNIILSLLITYTKLC